MGTTTFQLIMVEFPFQIHIVLYRAAKIDKLLPQIKTIHYRCSFALCDLWNSINNYFFLLHITLFYLPQHGPNTYQPVNKPIELYLEWLSNQGPQSKYEYSTFCQGHSKLPIHTASCLPQFPQQPITIAMESRETIATLRPWMLLAGSME